MNDSPLNKQSRRFDVETIDRMSRENPDQLVDQAEQEYASAVKDTAEKYLSSRQKKKIILISGPSASGKTITSHLLTQKLKEHGLNPVVVSLDNFYLDKEHQRRNPDGSIRYESVLSIDLSRINRALWSLICRGEALIPQYDFITVRSDEDRLLTIHTEDVLIVEGLHALNPLLTYGLDYDSFFKLCITTDSGFYSEDECILSAEEVRFVRRAVRDRKHRGAEITMTCRMWPGVREGEQLYIRPFYAYADVLLNTVHSYEPLVYKAEILQMLGAVIEHPEYGAFASELYRRLLRFGELPAKKVPSSSMLQEFVG